MWNLLAYLVLLAVGCAQYDDNSSATTVPPPHILRDALWVGSLDSGVYVLLNILKSDRYQGTIYYPNGEIGYTGTLILTPPNAILDNLRDASIYEGWDGNTLYLSKGRQLKVLEH